MHSTLVQPREKAARELVSTLQLHGKRVGMVLAEVFESLLEDGEELPDYVLLQRLMARAVRARLADLLATDEAYRAIAERFEEASSQDASPEPFLRARLAKADAERQEATEIFDQDYFRFSKVLEALYILAGEEDIAERLRPRELASDTALPEAVLAEAEIPEPPEGGTRDDRVQRRILTRGARRPGRSQWLGFRIFRRRRSARR